MHNYLGASPWPGPGKLWCAREMKELRQDALEASASDLMFENHHNRKGRGLYLVNNSLSCFSRMLALHDHRNRQQGVRLML